MNTLSLAVVLSCGSAMAQVPTETTDDINKQQIVPELAKIPKPAKGYGTVVGRFVFDGDIPEKELLHKQGDPKVKDGETCAAKDHYKNDLVINEKNKGIRNIFLYEKSGTYSKKKDAVHPDLRKPKSETVYFDQKGCRFFPKALLVRAGQKVVVLSNDDANHNTRTAPTRNQPVNFTVGANDRKGTPVPMVKPELLPIEVKCDLHPWMRANWLVLDHPYMAISNEDGRFMIANLPEGKHEFRLWHSRGLYLHKKMSPTKAEGYEVKGAPKKTKFYVEVKSGEILNLKEIKLKAEWFKE